MADLWSPRVPSRWPNAGPRRKLNTEESERHLIGQKANVMCSPLMSPAKRTGSTLGPLGFIYPFFFFFCSRKESTGRQVRQVPQERHTPGPKALHVYVSPIHVVGFHILRLPLKRYGKWRFFFGRSLPASAASFSVECSLTRATEAERTALHVEPKNSRLALNERLRSCGQLDRKRTMESGRNVEFFFM